MEKQSKTAQHTPIGLGAIGGVGVFIILGYDVIPVIFIIPTFNILTIICTIIILKNIHNFPVSPGL